MVARKTVVLPVCDSWEARAALPWAEAVAGGWQGVVVLFGAPGPRSGRGAANELSGGLHRELTELAGVQTSSGTETPVSVGDGGWTEVLEGASRGTDQFLLLPCSAHETGARLGVWPVLAEPPCDLALIRLGTRRPFRSVLLALRGGPDAALALRVAVAVATGRGAQVTALHLTPYAPRAQSDPPFHDLRSALQQAPAVTRVRAMREPCAAAILRQARGHDLLVVEASTLSRGSGEDLDMFAHTVLNEASCTVLAVKSRLAFALPRPYSSRPGPVVREAKRFNATLAK